MTKKVTVYCSSSNSLPQKYYDEAKKIGAILAKNNITITYGGGSAGLMGAIADSALENGGRVVGVIPTFMKEVEWDHKGVHLMIETEDMAERKKILIEGTDAVIALPGGVGTFEELFEVVSAKRLWLFSKPIVLYNFEGFYDPFIQMLEKCIEDGFMKSEHRNIWSVATHADEILEIIKSTPEWDKQDLKKAQI